MANQTHTNNTPASPAPTPLGSVLSFTFLNSLGTGAVQMGIFFLLQSAFGFGRGDNYIFGLVLYGAYVVGALAAGGLLRRLARLHPRISTRGVLAAVLIAQAAASFMPRTVAWISGAQIPPEWTVWLVAVVYGVFTGVMWPIVESYLSGGRTGRGLNMATGRFNVVWSVAVLASFWLMSPLIENSPLDVITVLGAAQLLSLVLLLRFGREPAKHLAHQHEPHPESWRRLLAVFRVLLPLSYIIAGTLAPLLPSMLEEVGVREAWRPPIASAWLTSRVVVFFIFARWPGWHGRRWMPVLAGVLLLAGFAGAIVAPRFDAAALPLLIATLAVFGAGHAMIYLGALYYAMEVGRAEVEAGGVHEALIGLGYALGPAIGITVLLLGGADSAYSFDTWLIAAVAIVTLIAGGIITHNIRTFSGGESASSE